MSPKEFNTPRQRGGIARRDYPNESSLGPGVALLGANATPAHGEIPRNQPVGRIAFANSDVTGIMDRRASIQEAHRAVKQCLEA